MGKLFGRAKGSAKARKHENKKGKLCQTEYEYDDIDDEEYYEDDEIDNGEYYEEDEDWYGEDDDEYYEEEDQYDDADYYEDEEEQYDEVDDEYYAEDDERYEEDDDEYYEDEEEQYDEGDDEYYAEDDQQYDDDEYYVDDDDAYYADDEEQYDGEDDEDYGDDEELYDDDDDEYYEDDEEQYDEEEDDGYYEDEYGEVDEDDDYYEDDDDDEDYDDEEDYDEEDSEGGVRKIIYKITHMSAVDHIIAFTGAAVLLLAVFAGMMYFGAKSDQTQIEAFAEIGTGVEDITMIGQSGLVAISDAQAAKLMAASMEEPEEAEPADSEGEKIEVVMNLTSIQKDLKIKFINSKTGKLIPDLAFEVEVEKPSGGTFTFKDDDKDGIIYETNIEPGRYQIKMTGPATDDTYKISDEVTAITVRDTIEYKKVDVSDEVKTEAQVNVAVEDTKVNETVVESTNTDTVEWVESTKTLIEGTETSEDSYEKVDKSLIADPGKQASLSFRLLTAPDETNPGIEGDGGANADPTPEPAGDPTPEPTKEPDPVLPPTPEPTLAPAPTEAPTAPPTPQPTMAPTAVPVPTATPLPTATPVPAATPLPTATPAPTATAQPTATPTAQPTASPTAKPNDPKNDTTTTLKTTSGETLWVKDGDGNFREAKYADYYTAKEFYRRVNKTTGDYRYTGWQEIDGATYFFDKDGNKVTGEQVIQGAKYNFNSDGSLNTGSGQMGIDVSKWNGNIDWNAVKNSGVSYVIIRCGYRGSTTGALIEDPMFRSNIQGASSAGLKVGVYFFTQAVNEVEAVEEASMVLGLIKGYNISYPVFLDVEPSNGRADGINASTRTAVCRAFCQTIQNSGYKAGIYANKTWLNSYVDAPSLSGYKIWLAQYAAAPTYNKTRYDMWQYSSKGSVSGIKGNVDMNISYMGY